MMYNWFVKERLVILLAIPVQVFEDVDRCISRGEFESQRGMMVLQHSSTTERHPVIILMATAYSQIKNLTLTFLIYTFINKSKYILHVVLA